MDPQSHSPNLLQSTRWGLIVLILGMSLSSARTEPAFAQIPRLLRYQGTLTDSNGVLLDGSYDLTFRFYDKETGGTKMWEEIQTAVQAKSGAFSVLLGKVTSLALKFDQDCWLAVSVNGAAELSPRHR
ncbi:MAG: hypothetical protein HY211_03465 [Candidatus Omnitrophica bacterium]|nr:hypothetical protein [Candidatus Omnitrophota bacterium]